MSTFVLVHGAWHGGWCYKRVSERLRAEGHLVFTPTNTGLGERSHLYHREIDLEVHITDILNVIKWEEIDDFVLVGHSYGGMIITGVADRVPEKVRRLVYLDAFVPQDGQSIFDLLGPQIKAGFEEAADAFGDGWRVPSSDPEAERKTDALLNVARTRLSLQNRDAARLKRTYVLSTNKADDDLLAPVFRSIAARVRDTEGWDYFEKPWVHYPVLDQAGGVEAVTGLLLELTP